MNDTFNLFDWTVSTTKAWKFWETKAIIGIGYTYDICDTTYHNQLLSKSYSYPIYNVLYMHSLMTIKHICR